MGEADRISPLSCSIGMRSQDGRDFMKRGLFVALVGLALLVGLFALTFKGRRTAPVAVEQNAPEPATNQVPVTGPHEHSEPVTQKAAYVPPEVSTPELRKLVDRRCSTEERVHGSTTGAILDVKDEQDLKALVQVFSDPEEDDTVRHEIANVLFQSEFAGLEAELFRILENPAEKSLFRGWAVQHLGKLLLDSPATLWPSRPEAPRQRQVRANGRAARKLTLIACRWFRIAAARPCSLALASGAPYSKVSLG